MVVKKVRLVNYRQYADRTVDIDGTLVAVTGRNGHGKSNFLKGIQYALTGEIPGAVKSDLLRWGEKSGYVELWFDHMGVEGHIVRSVSDNKVTLDYDGVRTSGIKNVAEDLKSRLGIDKDVMKQAVFVAQKEVDAVISAKTDKRERETAFQRLIGIDTAVKTHKTLTDWIAANARPANYDVQLEAATSQLDGMKDRLKELAGSVAKSSAERAALSSVDERDLRLLEAVAAHAEEARRADARLSTESAAAEKAEKALADLLASPRPGEMSETDPGVDLQAAYSEMAALERELNAMDARSAAEADAAKAADALAAIAEEPHPSDDELAESRRTIEGLSETIGTVKAELKLRRKTLALLDDAAHGGECRCPVCASSMDPDASRKAVLAVMAEFSERERALSDELDAAAERDSGLRIRAAAWSSRNAAAEKAAEDACRRLDASPDSGADRAAVESALAAKVAAAKAQIAYNDAYVANQQELERRAAEEASRSAEAKYLRECAERASIEFAAAADAAMDAMDAAGIDSAPARSSADRASRLKAVSEASEEASSRIREILARKAELDRMDRDIAAATAAQAEVGRTIANLTATVASLRESKDAQDKRDAAMSVVDRVRDWFHYANGPRVMTLQALEAMTVDVNRFLGNFTAPFVVVPDPDSLGFRVMFTDGRQTPDAPPSTDVLSGGEQVQLAVAFRLAVYVMFAGKLGLLSLDEPTAYLDDSNVDRFGVLLSQVKTIAKSMNVQVFMATHERSVMPHMDAVVDLD